MSDDSKFRSEIHEKILQPAKELDNVPERNRVQVRDQKMFNWLIATVGGTLEHAPIDESETPSERRYLVARDIFAKALSDFTEEELREFASFISQKCVLIYVATTSFDDAFRLFTIVNDRGEQLRRIDILEADNLSPTVVANDASRSRYAQQWEEMEERLGESRFEDIFHHLRLIYVQDKPQADLHKEFQSRVFGKPNMPKPGRDFLDSLSEYVDLYDSIFVARDWLEATEDHARYSTLMAAMVGHFGASEWKACLLFYAQKFGRENFYSFALHVEKLYLQDWVAGVRKDERYSTYTALLAAISGAVASSDVLESIDYDLDKIQTACRRANFYTAGFSKYFLLRAEILASELDHPREFVVRSVEHILPQTLPQDGAWRDLFTDQDHEELVHTAGNLVLLSKSKNSAASNREFGAKKETYLKQRVSDFPRSIQVLDEEQWTKAIIMARTEDFAKSILGDP